MTQPPAPPEGTLIKRAQVALQISQREAARRARLSEARWRQLVSGFQLVQHAKVPVRSPDKTLARMARAVGVTAEQLVEAGREDAAAALLEVEAEEAEVERAVAAMQDGHGQSRVDERWQLVEAVLRQARAGLTPGEDALLTDRVTALVTQPADVR